MKMEELKTENRLLMEASLEPVQGNRYQPTGFPNLGAATYQLPDGTQMCLVESCQSMANRMESVCWDNEKNQLIRPLSDLPYINVVDEEGRWITSSILEAHRINSPYILESKNSTFYDRLKEELKVLETGRPNLKALASTLYKYDANSLIHGVFLAKSDLAKGQLRVPRALSSFIEASNVTVAASGGVKKDDIDPKGNTKKGFGNVPFSRDEYTGNLKIYFNLDLAQIRGYGLHEGAQDLLLNLALYKIRKVLDEGLRLRTSCDLRLKGDIAVVRPASFILPSTKNLEDTLPKLIASEKSHFAKQEDTTVEYIPLKDEKSEDSEESPEAVEDQ